jgi:hypothetical protein
MAPVLYVDFVYEPIGSLPPKLVIPPLCFSLVRPWT